MEVVALPAFTDNYLWLLHTAGHAVVVDPGDASVVQSALDAHRLALDAILLTHHHHDHTGGVAELLHRHRCPVYAPRSESIPGTTRALVGGDRVEVLGTGFDVIEVPGHTRGHIAYHDPDGARLYCGDTLFGAGCGRLFEGTPAQMTASLARIAALPDGTRIHCAHEYTVSNLRFAVLVEPENSDIVERLERSLRTRSRGESTVPSTLIEERATNPFLRTGIAEVRESALAAARRPDVAPQLEAWDIDASSAPDVRTFASLRAWKNVA